MTIYNVTDYLVGRKRFKPQEHIVEEVTFNLIPLDDDMIQDLKVNNESYDNMLVYAAKRGVSIGRDRAFDDEDISMELDDMWEHDQFSECEPTLIHQVGELVCEISGLTEFIADKKLEEETAPDDEGDSSEFNLNGVSVDGATDIHGITAESLAADALLQEA